jgi:hypothetical protein
MTVASGRASVSGVVDHDAPSSMPTSPSTAASMNDGTKSGGPHRSGLRHRGVGTSGENWSIGNLWSRREVQSRSNCLGCSS